MTSARAFILAIAAALALTPIVWLHYFALLRRRGRARAAEARGRLVRPARDGRHARERASDAVRDAVDARGRRGRRSRSRCARDARRRTASCRSRAVRALTRSRRRGMTRARRSRRDGARAADVAASVYVRERAWALAIWAAMLVLDGRALRDRARRLLELPLGRFDLGNMVQAVWSTTNGRPLETTDGATGEQIVRLGVHVDPFLVLLAPLWMRLAVAARRSRSRRSSSSRSARCRSSGSVGVTSAPSALAGLLALGVPRVPVGRDERGRRDPSGDVRDPALPVLRLVPRHRAARSVRRLRGARDVDRRADGAADRWPRDLVRARARKRAAGASSRSPGSRGRSSPSTSSCPRSRATAAVVTTASTTRSAARRRESSRTLFTDPGAVARRAGRGATTSSISSGSALPLLVPLLALARARGRRAAAAPREHALRLPLDDGPPLPQRRRGDPVPDRRDGLRDRARSARRARALAAAAVLVMLGARSRSSSARGRALVGADAARRAATVVRRPRARRWRERSRSFPAMHAVTCVQHRRCASLRAALRLLRPGRRPRRVGRRRPGRSVGRERRLADPHRSPARSFERSSRRLERDPAWRKVFERDGVRRVPPRRG